MVVSSPQLRADIDEILPGVIADRRYFHANPEFGYQEFKTSRFVAKRLRALGVEDIRTGVAKSGITEAMRAQVEIDYHFGYPATINDPAMTAMVKNVAIETAGDENVIDAEPIMSAEDFSYFLIERPGCFFFVGSKNEEKGLVWTHHHPKFDFDEEALGVGIETMVRSVLRYLGE
jgi:metal-dependent amidase/aminoacylase/carboxypeptidase family protein